MKNRISHRRNGFPERAIATRDIPPKCGPPHTRKTAGPDPSPALGIRRAHSAPPAYGLKCPDLFCGRSPPVGICHRFRNRFEDWFEDRVRQDAPGTPAQGSRAS
ncbi:hypothetical protein GCM10018773_40440 [Streptomyces candidus]|nr:hypothetical protein GCM10018773_40440 [Streptomyces candidus]